MTKVYVLTAVASDVTDAIDENKIKVSLQEMRDILQKKKLFQFLAKYKGDFDLALYSSRDAKDRDYLNRNLSDIAYALHGRERKKFGVENNGLCLLVVYLIELVQRSSGKQDAWDVSDEK